MGASERAPLSGPPQHFRPQRAIHINGIDSEKVEDDGVRRVALGMAMALVVAASAGPTRCDEPPAVHIHLDPALLQNGLDLWKDASPEDKERAVLFLARAHRADARTNEEAAGAVGSMSVSGRADDRVWAAMYRFACLGLLLLCIPFVYWKRYPGKFRTLTWHSILAAAWFFVTVQLFGVPLVLFFAFTLQRHRAARPEAARRRSHFRDHRPPRGGSAQSRPADRAGVDRDAVGQAESFLTSLADEPWWPCANRRASSEPLLETYRRLEWITGPLLHLQTVLVVAPFLFSVYPVFVEYCRCRCAARRQGEETK